MSVRDILVILPAGLSMIYLILSTFAIQRETGYGRMIRVMFWYALTSSLLELSLFFIKPGIFVDFSQNAYDWQRSIGIFLLSITMLACTGEFTSTGSRYWGWVWFGLGWAAFLGLAPLSGLAISAAMQKSGLVAGWVVLNLNSLAMAYSAYSKSSPSIQRQRILMWLVAVIMISIADGMMLFGLEAEGSLLLLVGFVIQYSQVFIHSSQDLAWIFKRTLSFVFQGLLSVVLLFGILLVPFKGFTFSGLDPAASAALAKALFLALIAVPFLWILSNAYSRRLISLAPDTGAIARGYANEIAGIVSLEQLAKTSLNEINTMLELEFTGLFLVKANDKDRIYDLDLFDATPGTPPTPGPIKMAYHSPIIQAMTELARPIAAGELLNLPNNPTVTHSERTWVAEQPFKIYVSIHSAQGWLGLFALGPKRSGERMYERDLDLLNLLAVQTAAVLANARLFDDTMRLNVELQHAQAEILENNRKLKELDEMKSAFIGVLTHELRTPIANIQFSLQVLEMYLKDQMKPEHKAQFSEVNGGVKYARGMIDNLVNFAAFLNDRVQLRHEQVEFREVLRDALLPFKDAVDAKGLRVRVNLTGDSFKMIGDRQLLKEAVSQLVSNAIKFSSKGEIWITCWTTGDALCLDVQDSGIGIPNDRLELVWNAFTQLTANSLKRGVEGLGLGLGLVKYIITAHGGQVWVESKEGEGSIFGFKLPRGRPGSSLAAWSSRSASADQGVCLKSSQRERILRAIRHKNDRNSCSDDVNKAKSPITRSFAPCLQSTLEDDGFDGDVSIKTGEES